MNKRIDTSEIGISEIVGALILSALIIIMITIVAVSILSEQDTAPESPALRIDLGFQKEITLTHRGGDTLYREKTRIMVDNADRTDDFKTSDGDDWVTFAAGDRLNIPGSNATGANIQIIHTSQERPALLFSTTQQLPPPPVANFTATPPLSGLPPLTIQFTDFTTGNPTSLYWQFGDGNTSTEQNPIYTYTSSGNYTVSLTAANAGGSTVMTKVEYITVLTPGEYIVEESVFVFGTVLYFSGDNVYGDNATIIIRGGLVSSDINANALLGVSNMYFDGAVTLDGGSPTLGNPTVPGGIYINGPLLLSGSITTLSDVYVNGSFSLRGSTINDSVYVDGNLILYGYEPVLAEDTRIYYTGTITHPSWFSSNVLDKCIHNASVPQVVIPNLEMPQTREQGWYDERFYQSSGILTTGLKIFSESYTSDVYRDSIEDVIIVASDGDIIITNLGSSSLSGVLYAPKGRVEFNGGDFEGLVIARDGFYVTSGGSDVYFKYIDQFISDPADYPFV